MKNCTGNSNEILLSPNRNINSLYLYLSPQAPGRQTKIRTSRTLMYSFPHNITENTKFDFSCFGGCIKIEKVSANLSLLKQGLQTKENYCENACSDLHGTHIEFKIFKHGEIFECRKIWSSLWTKNPFIVFGIAL